MVGEPVLRDRFITLGGMTVTHPDEPAQSAIQFGTPRDFFERANEFRHPVGRSVGRGWLLMRRHEIERLPGSFTDERGLTSLQDLAFYSEYDTVIFKVAVASTTCMSNNRFGGDGDSLYLVEVVDIRSFMSISSCYAMYNVRMPAPEDDGTANYEYYPESLNGTALWTWQTMLNDLWGFLPTQGAGISAPTWSNLLPGTPQNIRLFGVNAWNAIHDILEQHGMTTTLEHTPDSFAIGGEFKIIQIGDVFGQELHEGNLSIRLLRDQDPHVSTNPPYEATNLANAAESVRVFFPKKWLYYGVEKDTVRTGNWEMSPYYTLTKATGISGARPGTVLPVWDDMEALYNTSDALTNTSDLNTKAEGIKDAYYERYTYGDEVRYGKVYSGITTLIHPGSLVKEVIWRYHGNEEGMVTEIINRPGHELPTSLTHSGRGFASGEGGAPCGAGKHGSTRGNVARGQSLEAVAAYTPLDLGNHTHPVYPHLGQPVQIYDSVGTQGDVIEANSDGLYKGRVKRFANGTATTLDDCWIRIISDHDDKDGDVDAIDGEYFFGRLSGLETSGSDIRPVYLVQQSAGTGYFNIRTSPTSVTEKVYHNDTITFTEVQTDGVTGVTVDVAATDVVNLAHGNTSDITGAQGVPDGKVLASVTVDGMGHVKSLAFETLADATIQGTSGSGAHWIATGDSSTTTVTVGDTLNFDGISPMLTEAGESWVKITWDKTLIAGYTTAGSRTQVLAHINGTLTWIDTTQGCT